MPLLNEIQKEKVAQAIALAEAKTAGELVVIQAKRSDDYGFRRSILGVVLCLGLAQETSVWAPSLPLPALLLGSFACWLLAYFALGLGPLLRLIVPSKVLGEKSHDRAHLAFMQSGVLETRDRSGVLIFLSELEHRAIILADKGINERVDPDEWQNDVNALVEGIRRGDAPGALLKVIERVGELLAASFPPRADDENELSNEVQDL